MPDDVEPGPPRTVHVEKNTQDSEVDDYAIEGGYAVSVISSGDCELLITKTDDDEVEEFVAMYGQGTWIRVWVEEDADG